MRDRIRKPLAVVFGVLLVTAGALGSVAFVNDDVQTLDGASKQVSPVGGAAAWNVSDAYQGSAKLAYAVGSAAFDELFGSPNTEELEKADALETKTAIYDQMGIQATNNEQSLTTYRNYLNDTESIALMEGKNAYIRALENGSAESVARNRATEAVTDYYAVKQKNVIASWNTTVTVFNSSDAAAKNTTDVSRQFVDYDWDRFGDEASADIAEEVHHGGTSVESVTLVNATSEPVLAPEVVFKRNSAGDKSLYPTPTTGTVEYDNMGNGGSASAMHVKPPTEDYDRVEIANFNEYQEIWGEIDSQNDDVQSELDSFINATYEDYQQGEINESDLVDPYLGAREYEPETSDTWALRTLSAMGAGSPSNLSNIGVMNVSVGDVTYSGVLMSDGTPEGGYTVGETYNASNITGSQFVAETNGGVQELNGNFTLESAETTEGETYESGETIEYKTVNYQTTNTTEFQELQTELDLLSAEINARQDKLRDSGGGVGWLPDFGFGGIGVPGIAVVAALGAVLLLGRN